MSTFIDEASEYIHQFYADLYPNHKDELFHRLNAIKEEISSTGSYMHTDEELTYGAKIAWRNSNRCIGRLSWDTLSVFDNRNLTSAEDIAEATFRYMKWAENEGKIRPAICIFAPKNLTTGEQIRFWNSKLVRYAGYETNSGVIGDPDELAFTQECQKLGWRGAGTKFDVLPLVIQTPNNRPQFFDWPSSFDPIQVQIEHPDINWFSSLGLKWYAVPYVADMALKIGGIEYTAAPFNGWFMGTEIGTRNLADAHRYNMLPVIAEKLRLDMRSRHSLWKDRALTELNTAVLYSYRKQGVTVVDHHTAALQFERFERREAAAGRTVCADWTWIVPPTAGSTTSLFHRDWDNSVLNPNYYYMKSAFDEPKRQSSKCPFHLG